MYRRFGALLLGVTLLFAVGAVINAEATPPVPAAEDVEVHIGPLHIVVPDGKDETPDHFQHSTPQRVYMIYDPLKKRYLSAGKGVGGFNFWTEKGRASIWISKTEAEKAISFMFGAARRAEVHAFVLLPVNLRDADD